MKVAFFSMKPFEITAIEKVADLQKLTCHFFDEPLNIETVSKAIGYNAVCVFSNDDLSAAVLEKLLLYNIHFVSLRSTGFDHVDLAFAKQNNIRVAYVPEYSPYSIAEHTIMLIMALNRKLLKADKLFRQYNFELDPLVGFDMNGKTVGIIGTGKIGSVVAKILHGFGCHLLGYDVEENKMLSEKYGLQYVSLNELLAQSEIITIHCPLNESTRYMIDAAAITKMKKGVMLINTSRGAITNTKALIDFLKNGHIGYLGLDVYEYEKGLFFYNHSHHVNSHPLLNELLSFENVIITGHQAFLTETALKNIAETTVENLLAFKTEKGNNELT